MFVMKKIILFLLYFFSISYLLCENPIDIIYQQKFGNIQEADSYSIVRRLSLHLRGKIPNYQEVQYIKNFKNKDELVNYYARIFLKSSDFANYWSLYFGDLLREKTKIRNSSYASYYKYIADSLDQNKPYDQFVRELLTSLGSPDKNPAVNFYLRDNADPLEVAEYVSRAFYGKRLSCARCHDHPFENFTQREYYGLAAFFGQVYIRNYSYDFIPWERIQDLPAHLQDEYKKKIHEWNKIPNKDQNKLSYATVSIEKELGLRFPVLDNKPGGDIVKPRLPDGTIVSVKNEDLREIFADWLVRQERFRKVIINRIWTKLMGWSFFYPLDNWNDKTKIQHPEILDLLDKIFVEKRYRIKDLIYVIVTSKAYQRRSANPKDIDKENPLIYFPAVRMDYAQLFNSLIQGSTLGEVTHVWERNLVIQPNQPIIDDFVGNKQYLVPQENKKSYSNACEFEQPPHSNTFLAIFGAGSRDDIDSTKNTMDLDQVLTLMNGNLSFNIVMNAPKKDTLKNIYEQNKSMMDVFDYLFINLLSRPMTSIEKDRLRSLYQSKYFTKENRYRVDEVEDFLWSIIQSKEFLYIH